MIDQEDISRFSFEAVSNMLAHNPEELFLFIEKCAKRELSISEIGIPVDRKLLYSWKKADLIPFLPSENTWTRFSFLDVAWLQVLLEFRSLGVSLDKLKEIKNQFFDPSFAKDFFSNMDTVKSPNPELQQLMETKLPISDNQLVLTDQITGILDSIQFSKFALVVYAIIWQRANWSLYLDGEGKIDAIDLNRLVADPITELPLLHDFFSERTVAMVNLRKIIAGLTDSNGFFQNDLKLGMIMSENSVQQLQKLFSENKIKEITFRTGAKGRPVIYVTQLKSFKELEKECRKLTKKGNYFDMVLKTRDGNRQYFDKTELFKL